MHEFDGKLKSEYMGSSIKRALLLTKPTMISVVPLTDTDTLKGISDYVDVGMTLTQVLEHFNQVSWLQTQTLSGTGRSSQLLNLTGKIQTMAQQKQINVGGRTRKVSSMESADQEGSVVEIHVWDDAYEQVKNLTIGDGITIVGCSAQREADG